MTGRRALLLALVLVVGLVGGFGTSWVLGENPPGSGAAAPVAAASPSLPVDPVPELLPDPDYPPLEPGIALADTTVGQGEDFQMTVPAPEGWRFVPIALNEWQWRPFDQEQSFGYVMRVEQVLSNRRSIDWTLDRRLDELDEDELDFRVVRQSDDSVHYTYITNNHLRHGFLTWLDVTGTDNAQVEVAVSGRRVDEAGLADLIERVAAGVRLG
ncbi:hypothetical protein EUA93_08225 [Nocardioides oleivorans]|uniref:Uncharacterized protein n=1 Tax=Nocardioides oleivorans TaxID=273676 RepID=A0A4V1RL28_9ACTN|nr:hypothetical protein [Nocardioides oleivorans]RYB94332.1 hypothetical protein EUA93_08225 [Nocardioides oleivorans]